MHRVYYLDILRLFATLAVILLHVSILFARDGNICWYAGTMYSSLSRWCVPVFIMISGALFLQPEKVLSIRVLYSKYILRLLVALFSWQIFYTVVLDPLRPVIINILHGSAITYSIGEMYPLKYHLWFLPMMIGGYICMPMLKMIATNKSILLYYLLLWFIYSVYDSLHLIPSLQFDVFSCIADYLKIHMVYGYSGYFLLGYYFSTLQISRRQMWISVCMFICVCCLTVLGVIRGYGNFACEDLAPNIILMSCAVFVCLKYVFSLQHTPMHALLYRAEQFSRSKLFGIYLVHPFVLAMFPFYHFYCGSVSFILIPLLACLIFIISLYIIRFMQRIPYLRYICS